MKHRHAGFDAEGLGRLRIEFGRAGVDQRASSVPCTGALDEQVEAGLAGVGRSRNDHRTARPAFAAVDTWQLRRGMP